MKNYYRILYLLCIPFLFSICVFARPIETEEELAASFERDPRFKYIYVAIYEFDRFNFKGETINIPSDDELKKMSLKILEDYQGQKNWEGNPDAEFIQSAYDVLVRIQPRFNQKVEILKNYLVNDPFNSPIDLGDFSNLSKSENIGLHESAIEHLLSRLPKNYDLNIIVDTKGYDASANSDNLNGEQILSLGNWVASLGALSDPNAKLMFREYAKRIYHDYDNKILWSYIKHLSRQNPEFRYPEIFEEIAPADVTPEFEKFLMPTEAVTHSDKENLNQKLSLHDLRGSDAESLSESRAISETPEIGGVKDILPSSRRTEQEPPEIAPDVESSQEPPEQSSNWWLWLIGLLVVVGGLAVVVRRKG